MKTLTQYVESIASKVNGFCILKPGFMKYEDEFLTLLKNNGWKVINRRKGKLSREQAAALYSMHEAKPFYQTLVEYMQSDESLCLSCSKKCDDPIKEMNELKDKVRKSWGEDDMKNAMHSSDSIENVERESKICCDNIVEGMAINITPEVQDFNDEIRFNEWLVNELESLFAEEIIAWYQYLIISEFLAGPERTAIKEKYLEFAKDEYEDHALKLLKRIDEIGGRPGLALSIDRLNDVAQYKAFVPSAEECMVEVSLQHNIEAEHGAIKHYKEVEEKTRGIDVITNRIMKEILADEQEHLTELQSLLDDVVLSKQQNINNM